MNTHTKSDLASASLHGDELISTPIGDIELVNAYFDDDNVYAGAAMNRLPPGTESPVQMTLLFPEW